MDLIDFILNLAGLLLWLNWRPASQKAMAPPAISLISTLRRPERREPKRWTFLVMLLILVAGRAFLYWRAGPQSEWTAYIQLIAISLPCRSVYLGKMILYSCVSFGLTLFTFYSWLILLSVVNRKLPAGDGMQRLVRAHLGWCEVFPWPIKLLLPLAGMVVLWLPASLLFTRLGMMPPAQSFAHALEQAVLIGVALFLVWKNLLVAILLLHTLNSYVYLGNHPFWGFVSATARNLIWPLSWLPLCIGKIDLLPVVMIGLVAAGERFSAAWLAELYRRLPL